MKISCPVILASASPRRKELLAGLGIRFSVEAADVEEIASDSGCPAEEIVCRNAALKALAIAERHPEALVIGADTVVECAGRIYGKPGSPAEAAAMLRSLSGREHRVLTGVALIRRRSGLERSWAEISLVFFKPLSEAAIQEYLRKVNGMDKAGAYAIQEHSELILARLEGSLSNVIGLPMERLTEELSRIEC